MRPKIYLFGDSITEASFSDGWGSSLANHFCRTCDIVLRGYSGYNTRWVLKVLDRIFPPVKGGDDEAPKAITVFFGANDASIPDRYAAYQHVPLDEYKQNLHSIVSFFKRVANPEIPALGVQYRGPRTLGVVHNFTGDPALKQWPGTLVVLITPPPIDEEARLCNPYFENPLNLPERTNDAAGSYAKACVEVAEECGCPVIDLWTKMQQFSEWKKAYLSDGLHLTKSGNELVFDAVLVKLKEEGISLETLPSDLPMFHEIDPKDPLKVFEK